MSNLGPVLGADGFQVSDRFFKLPFVRLGPDAEKVEELFPVICPVFAGAERPEEKLFHNLIDARARGFCSLVKEFLRLFINAVDGDRFRVSRLLR